MKKIYLILFGLLVFFTAQQAQAQETETEYTYVEEPEPPKMLQPEFGMQLGTGFGVSNGWGSYSSTQVSPSMRFLATPKLSISAGLSVGYTQLYGAPVLTSEGFQKTDGGFVSSTYYVQGSYQATDKLTISGTVFYQNNNMRQTSPFMKSNDFKGVDLQLEYKVSDKVTIGGRIMTASGTPNGYYNPAFSSGFGNSPFGSSPFYSSPYRRF
ncbi:hypothetical protein V6R21_12295 [Limibacter armeniacum]|uniref:hypothetical protein n=1 Tax=Limibacter armeniacum TaxID=466084 RepID=UPI002FE55BC4